MSLLHLPPELLLRISWHLTTPELGSLRRTCKQIENALFASFAREFFTKKQFMLEQVSLQALVDIANHPTLSAWLSEVIIDMHGFPINFPHMAITSRALKEMQKQGHISGSILVATGKACDMLVEAFRKLPNLKTVNIRDYSARGRTRDGEASWRSHGWSYNGVFSQNDYRSAGRYTGTQSTVFPLVLHALARAQAKPEGLEVFLRKPKSNGVGLQPTAFGFSKNALDPGIDAVFNGLRTLMLCLAENVYLAKEGPMMGDGTVIGGPWDDRPYDDDNTYEAPLRLLLQRTPNLTTLRLNFDPDQWYGYRILDWLGRPTSTTLVPFAHLTGLDLGMLTVSASILLGVISKPRNLKSLNLWKVALCVDFVPDVNETPTSWCAFLRDFIPLVPATLTSMLIGYAFEVLSYQYLDWVPVRFADQPPSSGEPGIPQQDRVSYHGIDIREWLGDTAACAVREKRFRDSNITDEDGEGETDFGETETADEDVSEGLSNEDDDLGSDI